MAQACKWAALGCGGCRYSGLPYPEQLKIKQEEVQRLLGGFGPVKSILGMAQPEQYRCKVISTFALDRQKRLISGLYAGGTHDVLPVDCCLLEDSTARRVTAAVRSAAAACRYPPFDPVRGTGLIRHVLVRVGKATGQVMVVLVTGVEQLPGSRNFVTALRRLCPEVTTVVQNVNSRRTSVVLGGRSKVLFGPGRIEDALCGCRFLLSPQSFFQVNPTQTERLYRLAIEAAGLTGRETVLDAYCGTGTIGIVAAKNGAAEVTGVENNAEAVRDAERNARRNKAENVRFVCADAGDWMRQRAADGAACDVVFMDPPRAGSDGAFLAALCRMAPARVVYISCNAETQTRDLAFLTGHGYRMQHAQPVDLFPFTEHVEIAVLMSRVQK